MRKREQQIFGINATILIVSIWLLMIFTFSPPEDWKQGMYGTQAIMSPSAIKALKLVSRSICLGLLCFATFRLLREPRSGRMTIVFLPVLAFTFWIFASVYWSPLKTVSLQQAISFTVSIILAFVFANSWRSCKDTSIYFMHLCGVLILISTGLLFLYIFAPQYGALTKQASGMFHSTTAGASASLGLLCNLGMFGIYRFRWSIWLLLPSIAVHVPVLILAGNRFSILLTMLLIMMICLDYGAIAARTGQAETRCWSLAMLLEPFPRSCGEEGRNATDPVMMLGVGSDVDKNKGKIDAARAFFDERWHRILRRSSTANSSP